MRCTPQQMTAPAKLIGFNNTCPRQVLWALTQGMKYKPQNTDRIWELNSHVWTKFIEVSVAIILHFFRCVDRQGPVGVHGDHHTANVRLRGEEKHGEESGISVLHKLTGSTCPLPCLSIWVLIAELNERNPTTISFFSIPDALLRPATPEVKLKTCEMKGEGNLWLGQ